MKLKSSLGVAALEGFKEDTINVNGLTDANEGLKGALKSTFRNPYTLGPEREKAEKELADLKEKLKGLEADVAEAKKGKSKPAVESFKAGVKAHVQGTAWTGHKLEQAENQIKALKEKIKAAEEELASLKGKRKSANESNEDDVDPDAADKEPKTDDVDPATTDDTSVEGADATAATSDVTAEQEGSTADGATDTATPQEGDATTDPAADPAADPDATADGEPATDAATGEDPAAAGATDGVDTGATDDATGGTTDDATGDPAAGELDENGEPVVGTGNSEDDANATAATAAVSEVDSTTDLDMDSGEGDDADTEIVEEEMGDVTAIDTQAKDVDDDVEKLTEATEALEGIVSVLDAAAQRGGLDVFGASLLRNNLNTVTKTLKVRPLMIPALEDMGEVSTKIDGANTTKQQVVAFINRIIETLKQAFNRFGEWITEIYKRLTNAFIAIERRAQKLGEQVKVSQMKNGKLDSKSLVAKLSVNGELVTDLPAQLDKIAGIATYLNDPKSYSLYMEAVDLCEQLVKDPSKGEEVRGRISEVLSKWATSMEKAADKHSRANSNSGKSEMFTVALLNAQTLNIIIPSSADSIRNMASTTVKAGIAEGTPEALSQADAIAVCQKVAQLAKEIRESGEANRGGVKELVSEIQKRKDTIVAIAAAAAGASEAESEAARKVIVFINTMFMSAPKLPVHAINKAMPGNLNAALDYVAASLGGKSEAPAIAGAPKQIAA